MCLGDIIWRVFSTMITDFILSDFVQVSKYVTVSTFIDFIYSFLYSAGDN
jgi:hypothetical protein